MKPMIAAALALTLCACEGTDTTPTANVGIAIGPNGVKLAPRFGVRTADTSISVRP